MKKLQILAVLGSAALLFAAQTTRASMPDGTYTNEFGASVPLWDVSGDYTNVVDLFSSVYSLNQAASGKLTGAGTFSFVGSYDGIDFNVTNGVLKIGGAVTGAGDVQTVRLTTTGSGTGTASYLGITLKITKYAESSQFLGKLDTTNRQVTGKMTFTASATFVDTATGKKKSASKTLVYKDVVFPVPTNATGEWTLTLDLVPKGTTKFSTGTGTIVTSSGNSATFAATSAYTAKTGTSAILLTGTGESKGSSLALKASATATNLNIETLSGSLFGQSIKFKAP